MNETVDSFLKEINEIVPPKNAWEECFDENSGFAYYWNTQTDEVTWEVPEGFKKSSGQNVKTPLKKPLFIPPPSEEKLILGSIPRVDKDTVKIYKLDDVNKMKSDDKNTSKSTNMKINHSPKSSAKPEDEKSKLISSYGTDSDSSLDEDTNLIATKNDNKYIASQNPDSNYPKQKKNNSKQIPVDNKTLSPYNSEDEMDILTQIQRKAKMLKQLGGEIPEGVKRLVTDSNDKKEVTGFSLLAGYGNDSEEESEEDEVVVEPARKNIFPIEDKQPVSTLFPISRPVDVQHFYENGTENVETPAPEENVDVKAFQRKRRIGVSLVNVQKKHHHQQQQQQNDNQELERPGFGFKGGITKEYPGFKSGGIIFAKEEDATTQNVPAQQTEVDSVDYDKVADDKLLKDVDDVHNTLNEKLKFLCEGHSPTLPVQVMIIQMDTLYTAMKEKCLNPSYLKEWLSNTCQDLTKLEQEAAPTGWLLQWDRMHKRYYYRNQVTGENQWQYPQPDIVSVDEAMDISTTPPPPIMSDDEHQPVESMNLILPPPPPMIKERSITPPPPPVISDYKLKETLNNGEPFPPGVDETDDAKSKDFPETEIEQDPTFTSELNSFYSDIATMASNQQPVQPESQIKENTLSIINTQVDTPPVKKKKKAKMGQGLAMKKKGVSKLVEKWKNVQKNYN